MDKVLIITYYWPPSGGAGVQRWLKLSNYLQESGLQVHLICPKEEDASYFAFDPSLTTEINPGIRVYPTKSIEPVNFYKKLVGKKGVPTAGFSNVDPDKKLQKFSLFLRSNLFVPDPRKYWGVFVYKKAKELIRKEGIRHVITTSPPHSVQLIGLKLKKKLGVKWLADLRDLWTDVYYYELLRHSNFSRRLDAKYERMVLEQADHITTVSPGFIKTYLEKSSELSEHKFTSIPNGYDTRDFEGFDYQYQPDFIFTYTGTVNLQYNFIPFLSGLRKFLNKYPEAPIRIRFVGFADQLLKEHITKAGLDQWFEYVDYVSHAEAIDYLRKSYALLLFGPLNTRNEEGGIPAKVFEYLNTGRKIIYVGKKDGFVANILEESHGGWSFESSEEGLENKLESLYDSWKKAEFNFHPSEVVNNYSRKNQAMEFRRVLNAL